MATRLTSASLTFFRSVCAEVGLDPHRLLRDARLDAAALSTPDIRLPAGAVIDVLERAAKLSNCQAFGLRMAEARRVADVGAISLLLSHQPSFRGALEAAVRYRHLLNEALAMHLEEDGDLAILRIEILTERRRPSRQAVELAVGTIYRIVSELLGQPWRPHSVAFVHAPPTDLGIHHRLFGGAVRFGAEFNGFILARADLDRPNPGADPAMAEYARRYIDQLAGEAAPSAAQEVRRSAYLLMPLGRASIDRIASELDLNPRTLQRRLESEGSSFSDVVNEVRRELAARYLANPRYSMTDISQLLGYAQTSAFTRWFGGEFGAPPTKWRMQTRAAASSASP